MFKREWVNAGAAVVAAMAAVGLLMIGMVSLAAGFMADLQASLDAMRTSTEAAQTEMRASVEAVRTEMRALIEAAQAENRALIEAAQAENRAAHAELGRKIESGGERIDRLYELLLAQANP